MCLSKLAFKLFNKLASTTWDGKVFQVVAILLGKNSFLAVRSLHSSLTIWWVCLPPSSTLILISLLTSLKPFFILNIWIRCPFYDCFSNLCTLTFAIFDNMTSNQTQLLPEYFASKPGDKKWIFFSSFSLFIPGLTRL